MRGATVWSRQVTASAYDEAVRFALFQQVPTALPSLMVLDGGGVAKVCGIAVAGFWGAASLCVARRPVTPTRGDLLRIRFGFFPVLIATAAAAAIVGGP